MTEEFNVPYTVVKNWIRYYKKDGNNTFPDSSSLQKSI